VRGRDYHLDPSGLWFAMSSRLDPSDYLAVSYTTAGGGFVGSFPAADRPGAIDSLALIVEPLRGPDAGTFRHEMRQVYRVAGADLDPTTLRVVVSLNRSERPQSGLSTYLGQLGLAVPSDENLFDRFNRLFPRTQDPEARELIRESYIVFPHLQPFADATRLTTGERSDSLYRTPLYLLLTQGPPGRFQIRMQYDAVGGADRSTLSLDALQIRQESEQLSVEGRPLIRGVDYTIDYLTGLVTFRDPEALFGSQVARVTARFEQQDFFVAAPTTILGFSSTYSLGRTGAVNLIGVFQREATAYNRPQLGFEAKANLVAGVNTALRFEPFAITRALDRFVPGALTAPSQVTVNAELAFSKPDANRSGAAYLEEFEADAGRAIPLSEHTWQFASAPQRTDGLGPLLGFGSTFEPDDAVALTWQNLVPTSDGSPFRLRPQDIDTSIVIVGRGEQSETALFVALHADTAGGYVRNDNSAQWTQPARPGRPRWRSMVTPLSATGIDLSRSEYLEFWVFQSGTRSADSAGVQLLFDIGSVSEDALALAPTELAVSGSDSLFAGRQYVGRGLLNSERGSDGIFNANEDDIGILSDRPDSIVIDGQLEFEPALCERQLSGSVQVFPWGDLSARCTNGNGLLDSEDLNGDLILDARGPNENVFRYVVDLSSDRYKVPDRGVQTVDASGRVAGWTLYRVPLRGADAIQIGTPTLRLVQHFRMTVVAPPDDGGTDIVARFALARMRLVGAPWVRRATTPIAGIAGSAAGPTGEVITSIVSTENIEVGYTSPPGTGNIANDRNAGQDDLGTQVNEKSLRIIARGLQMGERAEAYFRFPAGRQNLLNYRELRVWARGHGEGWERGDLEAFIKLGSDDRNFYMYRAPARTTSWEPELIIDLETWRRLRAIVEQRWLAGEGFSGSVECGGDPGAYVACEGPYLVHLQDPGINPPNLAAVQEVAAGLLRVADLGALPEAEVWIDDIRLVQPVSQTGKAIAMDARVLASDVGDLSVSFVRQDGQFRQIGQAPTYRTENVLQLGGNWRLDRFLPQALGLVMPATIAYVHTGTDPTLISGTDIRGASLEGLRTPRSRNLSYSLTVRRGVRGNSWLTRGLIDPLAVSGTLSHGSARSELTDATSSTYSVNTNYNLILPRTGPVLRLVALVPPFLRQSQLGRSLAAAKLSLIPSSVRLSSGLIRDEGQFRSYQVPVFRAVDSALVPTQSLNHVWRNGAGLTWQPLGMLLVSGDLTSSRDLRHYPDSTTLGRLAESERQALAGIDVGVERDRQLSTNVSLTPVLSSWLRPRYSRRSGFALARSLTSRPPVRGGDDSLGAFLLPQTLNSSRFDELGIGVDLTRLARVAFGDSSIVTRSLARARPLDISRGVVRNSTFDLAAFDPTLAYQLGFGDREDFRAQYGALAIGSGETHNTSVSAGADFPFGLSFTARYTESDALRFQRVGVAQRETQTTTREWPNLTLRWSRTLNRGPLALISVAATMRERTGITVQPAAIGATTTGLASTSFAPDVAVSFRNGMRVAMQLSSAEQVNQGTSSSTVSDDDQLYVTLSHSFRIPAWITRSRKLVSATMFGRSARSVVCLERIADQAANGCEPIADTHNQELSLGLRTDLAQAFSGTLDFGYTLNDAKHLNRRLSTMYLTVGFTLALYAGTP
jgi:hypothetical protein